MSNILIACYFSEIFYPLSPYRSQGRVKGQNMCTQGVICFILIYLFMQRGYFQKRKQINLFDSIPGVKGKCKSKIFVNARYCKLRPR